MLTIGPVEVAAADRVPLDEVGGTAAVDPRVAGRVTAGAGASIVGRAASSSCWRSSALTRIRYGPITASCPMASVARFTREASTQVPFWLFRS